MTPPVQLLSDPAHPWRHVRLPQMRDAGRGGVLTVLELLDASAGVVPEARRVYTLANDQDAPIARGGHRHPAGGKQEILTVVRGWVRLDLHARGGCARVRLEDPADAVVVPSEVWHGVTPGPGAILLAIATTPYAAGESLAERPCRCP